MGPVKLKAKQIEIIEYSGSWLREGLVRSNYLNTMELSIEATAEDDDEAAGSDNDLEMEISAVLEAL